MRVSYYNSDRFFIKIAWLIISPLFLFHSLHFVSYSVKSPGEYSSSIWWWEEFKEILNMLQSTLKWDELDTAEHKLNLGVKSWSNTSYFPQDILLILLGRIIWCSVYGLKDNDLENICLSVFYHLFCFFLLFHADSLGWDISPLLKHNLSSKITAEDNLFHRIRAAWVGRDF